MKKQTTVKTVQTHIYGKDALIATQFLQIFTDMKLK